MKFPVITLCGSSRFKDDFIRIGEELTLKGNIVISLNLFGHADHKFGNIITPEVKQMLDEIHREKIRMSDKIVVINRDDYIGTSTSMEILYATSMGIPVEYAFPHKTVTNFILDVNDVSFHKFNSD